jgi:hypothetical protein
VSDRARQISLRPFEKPVFKACAHFTLKARPIMNKKGGRAFLITADLD